MKKVLKFLLAAAVFTGVAVSDSTSFKVHVIGDSTVCNYKDNAYPQTGWGQILGSFFDGSRVQVVNYAIGGRSSKTFVQEGRLDEVKKNLQKGDIMMVQFGHNDRYFGSKAREVPFDSLGYWLQQYADVAKGAGATLVYVTPMNMNMGANGRNIFTEYNVVGKMEELAKKNGAVYVNLNAKSYNAYSKSWDPAYVSRYQFKMFLKGEYPNYPDGVTNDGTTHFQESGSIAHCQWIAEELESALKNESYISADNKANLTQLVSALKPRYAFTVKANVSNSKGLITHNQQLPGGAPLTLHVSPGSFGKKFVGWYDDDCNKLSQPIRLFLMVAPLVNLRLTVKNRLVIIRRLLAPKIRNPQLPLIPSFALKARRMPNGRLRLIWQALKRAMAGRKRTTKALRARVSLTLTTPLTARLLTM